MSWDMIMKLPIQERRALIHKHNMDSEAEEREINKQTDGESTTHFEGETINKFAERAQTNPLGC